MSNLPGARQFSGKDPFGPAPIGYVAGRGRGAVGFSGGVSRDDGPEFHRETDLSETNYDPQTGYAENLFGNDEYDEEDRIADSIYDAIDAKMDSRRKARREMKLKETLASKRAAKPTIQEELQDLRPALANVTKLEWHSLPEAQVYNSKRPRRTQTTFNVPDGILRDRSNQGMGDMSTRIDSRVQSGHQTPIGMGGATPISRYTVGGFMTPGGMATPAGLVTPGLQTNVGSSRLNELGEVKGQLLSVKLDRVIDQVSGQTVVDAKGYLTELDSLKMGVAGNAEDLKKARTLLLSVTQTNPGHAPGWIAAARLEQQAGNVAEARSRIREGCTVNPREADLWLEYVALERDTKKMKVLVDALKNLPYNVRLWREAVNLTVNKEQKLNLLNRALKLIPNSPVLWFDAVELQETREDKKQLLSKAVQCVAPSDVEAVSMYLKLADVCDDKQEARVVLNEARKKLHSSPDVWVAACKLEESEGNLEAPFKIMKKAIAHLAKKGAIIEREQWQTYIHAAETEGFLKTCNAIVGTVHNIGVEKMNRLSIWLDEITESIRAGKIHSARFALQASVEAPGMSDDVLWTKWIQLEQTNGTAEQVGEVLERATENCTSSSYWLMRAKHIWRVMKDVDGAIKILHEALENVAEECQSDVNLALAKIETETNQLDKARARLQECRQQGNSDPAVESRLWMQSVQLERLVCYLLREEGADCKEQNQRLVSLLSEVLPGTQGDNWKLWCIYGHTMIELFGDEDTAALKYKEGLTICPNAVHLWSLYIRHESKRGDHDKAKALLNRAKLLNPREPVILHCEFELLEAILEAAPDDRMKEVAKTNLNTQVASALRACPNSGLIWLYAVKNETERGQSSMVTNALKMLERDALVVWAGALVFWGQTKFTKARKWLHHSVSLNPKIGDIWVSYVAFELLHGNEKTSVSVINRAALAGPSINRGIEWCRHVKKVEYWRASFATKLRTLLIKLYPHAWIPLNKNVPTVVIDALKDTE